MSDTATAVVTSEVTPENTQDMGKFLDAVVQDAVKDSLPEGVLEDRPRDELGRFVKQAMGEGEEVAETPAASQQPTDSTTPETPTEATPEGAPAADAPVLPEGYAAVKPIEGRELAAQFTVLDADGELAIPDITIKYTANGRERQEPLDKVVKLAQMGVYNHEREQRLAQQQEESAAIRAQYEAAQQELMQARAYVERILADESAYLTEQERFALQHTPEAQLQRLQQEREMERQAWMQQQMAQQAEAFATNELLPAMDTLVEHLNTVSREEVAAKLVILMKPYERNGIVPPEMHPYIKQALVADVLPWAQQLHEERLSWRSQATKEAEAQKAEATKEAQAAKANAQKAKRQIGAAVRPVGSAPNGVQTREAPKPRKIETADEGVEDSIQSILSAMKGAA